MKRLIIAGTGSGCGKTTATMLIMAALRRRGLDVAPYKTGPDYIDPSFHRVICGRPSHNLDTWLMSEDAIRFLLDGNGDIAVIEGVMGFYDGLDVQTLRCSAWELAAKTATPVILVVDASGGAASVAATVRGFQTMKEHSGIAGVLVNRCASERHYQLIREAVTVYTGLPCVGYLRRDESLTLQSRHLGLIPAQEVPDVQQRVEAAAEKAAQTLDFPMLLRLAGAAPCLPYTMPSAVPVKPFRLGIAMDEAFSFYYQANLDLMDRMGMTLVPFSPLRDAALPDGLDGLYFGGGFPEVFGEQLSANASMLESVRAFAATERPVYGECGGMMYLSQRIDGHPMVGVLPLQCTMTKRLQRFGYATVTEASGLTIPAHEFHHAVAEPIGDVHWTYHVQKASDPSRTWACGCRVGHTLGAFAHLHFLSHTEWIRFLWELSEGGDGA